MGDHLDFGADITISLHAKHKTNTFMSNGVFYRTRFFKEIGPVWTILTTFKLRMHIVGQSFTSLLYFSLNLIFSWVVSYWTWTIITKICVRRRGMARVASRYRSGVINFCCRLRQHLCPF